MAHTNLAVDELETDDIYQAAYYKAAGCEYKKKRRDGNKVFFIFSNPAGNIKSVRESFFDGTGKVSAFEYSKEVKRYKELCFD